MNTETSTNNIIIDSTDAEAEGFVDAAVIGLLAASDEESMELLQVWLKEHATTLAPVVEQAASKESGLSGEASCAVLDALLLKPLADERATSKLMHACLNVIAARITESLSPEASSACDGHDDPLVSSTVAIVTAGRRAHLSEMAVSCLAKSGSGGSLVLVRSFDTVRDSLKLHVLQKMDPTDVWVLGDNAVASLSNSVSKLIESLEGKPRTAAVKFLEALEPEEHASSAEIEPTESLEVGSHVFHATWGVGTVIKTGDGTIKVDFGSAGTRSLLRKFATLRHHA